MSRNGCPDTLSSESVEWLTVPIRSVHPITGPVDLIAAAAVPSLAFVGIDAQPGLADWHVASWDPAGEWRDGYYLARLLVGPGQVELVEGWVEVWARVALGVETAEIGPLGRIHVV